MKKNHIAPDLESLAVDVSSLRPDPENARKRTKANTAAIKASFSTFGQQRPLLVFVFPGEDSPTVISGNGGFAAAKSLGWTKVAASKFAGTAEEARAYAIADNRTAELSEWDAAVLQVQVNTARANETISAMLDAMNIDELLPPAPTTEPEEDEYIEPPADPIAKLGDKWILGPHCVVCGDSTETPDVFSALRGENADMVWTDPPYNVAYEGAAGKIQNDSMTQGEFSGFLRKAFEVMSQCLKPGGSIYVSHADTEGLNFRSAFSNAGFKLASCLIWKKNALVLSRGDYHWRHEPILYGWKPGAAHTWYGGRSLTTIIEADKPSRSDDHPTMKPLWLIAQMLHASAKAGDLVLDPFGGSGSTLMACDSLGMRCATVELDPRFVDVIIARWERKTGQKAVNADWPEGHHKEDEGHA